MEKKINKVIDAYFKQFKIDIKDKYEVMKNDTPTGLLQFIYDYDSLVLTKDHFQKRKRVKNFVPIYDRCCAKRANDEQCTRRKKDDNNFCGTHIKGTPHGEYNNPNEAKLTTQKIEVWAQDIKGIIYYIDTNFNVYQTEDIVTNKENPKIIAKYVQVGDVYSIPELKI